MDCSRVNTEVKKISTYFSTAFFHPLIFLYNLKKNLKILFFILFFILLFSCIISKKISTYYSTAFSHPLIFLYNLDFFDIFNSSSRNVLCDSMKCCRLAFLVDLFFVHVHYVFSHKLRTTLELSVVRGVYWVRTCFSENASNPVAPGPLGPRGLGPPLNLDLTKKRQYSFLDRISQPLLSQRGDP